MSRGSATLGMLGLLMLVVGLAGARQGRPAGPSAHPDGPPRGPGGPPAFGQVLPGFLQERLNLTAEQTRQVERLQQEVDDRLAKILTDEQKRTLREMRAGFGRLGDPPVVHDVVLAKEGGVYCLFSTGRGITLHTSQDMVTWQRRGRVF